MTWVIILLVLILFAVGGQRSDAKRTSEYWNRKLAGRYSEPYRDADERRYDAWVEMMRSSGAVKVGKVYRCRTTGKLVSAAVIDNALGWYCGLTLEQRAKVTALMQAQQAKLDSGTATWIGDRVVLTDKRGTVIGYR